MANGAADALSKLTIDDLASAAPNLHKNLSLLSPEQVCIFFVGIVQLCYVFVSEFSCVFGGFGSWIVLLLCVGGVGESADGFESGSLVRALARARG